MACRSGLTPQTFEIWLDQTVRLDREAKAADAYAIPSLIVADLARTIAMAKQVEQAGLRVLELNIGTPYASQAKGVVATELEPERVEMIVSTVRQAIAIPLWVKITGQSERVPDLAAAAFRAGGEAVVMAGRLLGFIPNVETMQPYLGTTLGVGGYWNLPLTCHWLAVSRQQLGANKPLIATNGARNGLDVARMMLAGGSAVEMASAVMLRGAPVLSSALEEFDTYLKHKEMTAAELVGIAADRRKTFPEMPLRTDNWKKYVADIE
jgi:dihydroorotate dehydrogenase (NAD+) catalytic subunit